MPDLKKEIKLSQLIPRPKKKGGSKGNGSVALASRPKKAKKSELVGLKVGSSQIAAARVANNGGKPKLLQLARTPLDPGIVVNGEVRDVNALASALDSFFTEHKLPRKDVRLGIGSNRVAVRVVDVDVDDAKQLGNAVMFRANETLSIPMDQAVLDFHVVGESKANDGSVTRRVLLAAAYREPIDQFVTACHVAHIDLVGIDVEAFALLRAVAPSAAPQFEATPSAIVAVNIGHDRSTLAISDGTICDFTRVLDWGGARLESVLVRDLGLTNEEAEELKQSLSLADAEDDDKTDADPRVERAREALKKELGTLARELIASLQFYQSQPESLPIAEILVTGGSTRLPGFAGALETLVRARVREADPAAGVSAERPAVTDRDDLSSFTVAIGLGVGGTLMQAVNLLPADARRSKSAFSGLDTLSGVRVVQVGAAVTGGIAILLGLAYFHEQSVVHTRQNALAQVDARNVAVQAQVQSVKTAQAATSARLGIARGVVTTRLNWNAALTGLARVLPTNVHLTALNATSPTTAAAATVSAGTAVNTSSSSVVAASTATTAQTFTISGLAPSQNAVALVLDRLAVLPWLTQVTLQQTTRQSDGTIQFGVSASLGNEGLQ